MIKNNIILDNCQIVLIHHLGVFDAVPQQMWDGPLLPQIQQSKYFKGTSHKNCVWVIYIHWTNTRKNFFIEGKTLVFWDGEQLMRRPEPRSLDNFYLVTTNVSCYKWYLRMNPTSPIQTHLAARIELMFTLIQRFTEYTSARKLQLSSYLSLLKD